MCVSECVCERVSECALLSVRVCVPVALILLYEGVAGDQIGGDLCGLSSTLTAQTHG